MTRPNPRARRVPPPYRVRVAPLPVVIDEHGEAVAEARILEIVFPGETIETPGGRMPVLVGAGVAKILVGAITIRGVPLC